MEEREVIPPELAGRMRSHVQYLELVSGQLEALAAGDSEHARELADELLQLRAKEKAAHQPVAATEEQDEAAGPDASLPEHRAALMSSDLSLALAYLAEVELTQRQTQATWQELSEGAIRTARKIPVPRVSAVHYPTPMAEVSQVDVRF